LRHLRAVFNEAITNKLVPGSVYPFGKGGYIIPAGTNPKKALDKEDVVEILTYNSVDHKSFEQRSKDFWTLSYLTNGANFSDLFTLRWHNIDLKAKTISFVRNKTARTRKANQQVITARLFDESIIIINRWANKDQSSNSYVFPFINDNMNELRKMATLKQLIKVTNKWMEHIARKLEIGSEVSTYAARHFFATILLRSNAPLAFISQSLGHTNLKTTQNYLGSFSDDQTKEYSNSLI
jgi:integrase